MQITKQEIETMIQQAVLAGKAAADTSAKDFYKATERRLYALETLRAKIAEDKGRLEEIKKYGPAQRSKGIGRFMKTGVRLTPDEIQEAVVCDMEATIAADEYEVETMDNALAKIAGDFYYKAVSGKYMEGLSDDQVAAYLNRPCVGSCSRSTAKRRSSITLWRAIREPARCTRVMASARPPMRHSSRTGWSRLKRCHRNRRLNSLRSADLTFSLCHIFSYHSTKRATVKSRGPFGLHIKTQGVKTVEPIKTQVFRLDDIKPAPYNPRVELTAKDREFKALTASIEQHGLVQPLIVNIRDGYLIGGHQRLNVLKAAGETETEAVVVDLDEAHAKALCLALNKLDGEWDYGILYATAPHRPPAMFPLQRVSARWTTSLVLLWFMQSTWAARVQTASPPPQAVWPRSITLGATTRRLRSGANAVPTMRASPSATSSSAS